MRIRPGRWAWGFWFLLLGCTFPVGNQLPLADIHVDCGNKHACGKAQSTAEEQSVSCLS